MSQLESWDTYFDNVRECGDDYREFDDVEKASEHAEYLDLMGYPVAVSFTPDNKIIVEANVDAYREGKFKFMKAGWGL